MNKIKTLTELKKIITKLKAVNKKIVFTNGCYDLIHPGHLGVLNFAKTKGDILIVAVNSDSSIRKIKGPNRPIMSQKARSKILENIEAVNYVILFSQKTPYSLIKQLRPDVLVKGGDWKRGEIIGNDIVEKVCRVKLLTGYSTTKIIDKIKKNA